MRLFPRPMLESYPYGICQYTLLTAERNEAIVTEGRKVIVGNFDIAN